ncbi:murein biosynthesis integral membrane protein MurJ [candidate division KSB1 bacterium]
MPSNTKILRSGLLVFFLVFTAKMLSLVKEILIANYFGQGELTDAYFVSFQILNTFLYALGINILRGMSSSIFSENIAKNQQKNLKILFSTIFNYILILTAALTVICIWRMPDIINWLPFRYNEGSFELVVMLARVLLTALIFIGLSQYLGAVLNAFRSYFVPGISLVIANACMIISIVLLYEKYSIVSAAYGTLAGFFISSVIQFIYINRKKIKYKFSAFNIYSEVIVNFAKKSAPLLFVTVLGQISLLVGYIIALDIEKGMASALNYAGRLNDLSLSLFVLPLLTVLLPEFARDKALENISALKNKIKFGFEVIVSIVIFWTAFLTVFHREVIIILFERGQFTAVNTELTSSILLILMCGLFFQTLQIFLIFIYLGLQKTRSLTIIGVFSYCVYIMLLFILSDRFGVFGIAWANVVLAVIYSVILLFVLKYRHIKFSFIKNSINFSKIILSGAVIFLIFYQIDKLVVNGSQFHSFYLIIVLSVAGITGIAIYLFLLQILKVFTFRDTISGIKRYING